MVFTVSLLGAHHDKGSVGNKPATLIDTVWQKHLTLCLMPPYYNSRQILWPSILPIVVPSQTKE